MLQINVIREKAEEAEAIVKNITTEIQRLDTAKRNLTTTIQTIERWEMLSAVSEMLSTKPHAQRVPIGSCVTCCPPDDTGICLKLSPCVMRISR